jgi:hypothetical protein
MMKKALLMVALLAPGLAYGQNPSANLSINVVPGSAIACDQGPNISSIPAPAQEAGFTHCALNADFTDHSGATGGGGWVMNNPQTWLNQCKGTSTWGLFWLMWIAGTGTNGDAGGAPCNRVQMVTDGTIQVLNFQFAPNDTVTGSHNGLGLYWPLCGNSCLSQRPAMPVAYYEEITYRLAGGVSQAQTRIIDSSDENSVFDNGPQQSSGFLDMVWIEALSNNAQSATSFDNYSNCCGKSTAGGFWTPAVASYHTYANLTTTDGTTLSSCLYVDGAGLNYASSVDWGGTYCSNWANFGTSEINDHDRRFWKFIGDFELVNNAVPGDLSNIVSIYIKSIRIFTCANYKGAGNNCVGPLVFH